MIRTLNAASANSTSATTPAAAAAAASTPASTPAAATASQTSRSIRNIRAPSSFERSLIVVIVIVTIVHGRHIARIDGVHFTTIVVALAIITVVVVLAIVNIIVAVVIVVVVVVLASMDARVTDDGIDIMIIENVSRGTDKLAGNVSVHGEIKCTITNISRAAISRAIAL